MTTMPITLPTQDDVRALHQFIQARNEEEWQASLNPSGGVDDVVFERVRRLSNAVKLSAAGHASYLLDVLKRGHHYEQLIKILWENLTTCGEQWRDHPDWKPQWANPARAALLTPAIDRDPQANIASWKS